MKNCSRCQKRFKDDWNVGSALQLSWPRREVRCGAFADLVVIQRILKTQQHLKILFRVAAGDRKRICKWWS